MRQLASFVQSPDVLLHHYLVLQCPSHKPQRGDISLQLVFVTTFSALKSHCVYTTSTFLAAPFSLILLLHLSLCVTNMINPPPLQLLLTSRYESSREPVKPLTSSTLMANSSLPQWLLQTTRFEQLETLLSHHPLALLALRN